MNFKIVFVFLLAIFANHALPCTGTSDPVLGTNYTDLVAQYQQLIATARRQIDDDERSLKTHEDFTPSGSRSESTMAIHTMRSLASTLREEITNLENKISCYEGIVTALSQLDRYTKIVATLTWPPNALLREGRIYQWHRFLADKAAEVSRDLGTRRAFFVDSYTSLAGNLPVPQNRYPRDIVRYATLIEDQFIKRSFQSAEDLRNSATQWQGKVNSLYQNFSAGDVDALKSLLTSAIAHAAKAFQ